jgi:RNA polymerase sigma-70 factor, ECF subfamily
MADRPPRGTVLRHDEHPSESGVVERPRAARCLPALAMKPSIPATACELKSPPDVRRQSSPARSLDCSRATPRPHLLDPAGLPDYIDHLYRAAWALCGSRHDAEDLVQDTFATVLRRPRLLRDDNELGYLLRALRNTYVSRIRTASRRPQTCQLLEDDTPSQRESRIDAREIMAAIASAPAAYGDAVIAVDVLGMSYREAARALRIREATITTRLHRGRHHVARQLQGESARVPPRPRPRFIQTSTTTNLRRFDASQA